MTQEFKDKLNTCAMRNLEINLKPLCTRLVDPGVREMSLAMTDIRLDHPFCLDFRADMTIDRMGLKANDALAGLTFVQATPLASAIYGIVSFTRYDVGPGLKTMPARFWFEMHNFIACVISAELAMHIVALLSCNAQHTFRACVDTERGNPSLTSYMQYCASCLDGVREELLKSLIAVDKKNRSK